MTTKGNVRIYIRVSTEEQTIERQEHLIDDAKSQGFYVAGVYREKASGAIENRPELQKLISELQLGDYVVAEKMDRISRLPISDAQSLISQIKAKGAKLLVPGIVDFTDIIQNTQDSMSKIVLEAMQELLLKIALQMSRDDYEFRRKRQKEGISLAKQQGKFCGRRADRELHKKIIEYHILRKPPLSIAETANFLNTTISTVTRVCGLYKKDNNYLKSLDENGK